MALYNYKGDAISRSDASLRINASPPGRNGGYGLTAYPTNENYFNTFSVFSLTVGYRWTLVVNAKFGNNRTDVAIDDLFIHTNC